MSSALKQIARAQAEQGEQIASILAEIRSLRMAVDRGNQTLVGHFTSAMNELANSLAAADVVALQIATERVSVLTSEFAAQRAHCAAMHTNGAAIPL